MEQGYIGIRRVNNGYVVVDCRNFNDEEMVYVFTELEDVFNKVKKIFEGESS